MVRFLGRTILFLILIVVCDFIYGHVCEYMSRQVKCGETYHQFYICDSVNAEVLFMGTSRCRATYNPEVLSESLGLACHNCGRNGMGIIYHYGVTKAILQRYSPKMIVYDVLPISDLYVRDDNDIFTAALRNIYNYSGIDSILWDVSPTDRYKMLFGTYRYHSKLMELIGNMRLPYNPDYNGWVPSEGVVNGRDTLFTEQLDYQLDPVKIKYLEKFILEFKDKTQLVFVASPRFKYRSSKTLYPIAEMCNKYNIPFINHYNDPRYIDENFLFADPTHFNKEGAIIFSKQISMELRNHLKLK